MASAQVAFSGSEGGNFRCGVDMTRTYIGTAAENYETWTLTGFVDRLSGSSGITYSRPDAYYDLWTGVFQSGHSANGNVSISWNTATGRKYTRTLSNMRVDRQSNGNAVGINASFYFFAGFGGVDEATANVAWSTNTVPRTATLTATSGNVYETDNPTVSFSTPGAFPTNVSLQLRQLDTPTLVNKGGQAPENEWPHYATRTNVTSPYTWTLTNAERDAIRATMANTSQTEITYVVRTNDGSTYGLDSVSTSIITIDNRNGIAQPTFTNFSFSDTTSAVGATTADGPVVVQGKSVVRGTVSVANKATAIKGATMSSYTVSLGGSSPSVPFNASADVTQDINLSTIPTLSGNVPITIRAIDSRGYGTTVTKNIEILPYTAPMFPQTTKFTYVNQFDVNGGLNISLPGDSTLLNFSPLTYGGTDYNIINPTGGVQYQLHKGTVNPAATWKNISFTQTPGSTVLTTSASTLESAVLADMNTMGEDNDVTWYLTLRSIDKYNTVTHQLTLDVGSPIFRIGVDSKVYNNEKRILTTDDMTSMMSSLYPVGCIYITTVATDPGTVFGFGTWVAFGAGRVPVGYDAAQTEFDTVEEVGGSKTHTLTAAEIPAHTHSYVRPDGGAATNFVAGSNSGANTTTQTGSVGSGQAHNNLQPYIVVRMWKRTA